MVPVPSRFRGGLGSPSSQFQIDCNTDGALSPLTPQTQALADGDIGRNKEERPRTSDSIRMQRPPQKKRKHPRNKDGSMSEDDGGLSSQLDDDNEENVQVAGASEPPEDEDMLHPDLPNIPASEDATKALTRRKAMQRRPLGLGGDEYGLLSDETLRPDTKVVTLCKGVTYEATISRTISGQGASALYQVKYRGGKKEFLTGGGIIGIIREMSCAPLHVGQKLMRYFLVPIEGWFELVIKEEGVGRYLVEYSVSNQPVVKTRFCTRTNPRPGRTPGISFQ